MAHLLAVGAVVYPEGDDFRRGTWRQQFYVRYPVSVTGLDNAAIRSTGQTMNNIAVKYPVRSLSPDSISDDFHSLSLSLGNTHFKREYQRRKLPVIICYDIVCVNERQH